MNVPIAISNNIFFCVNFELKNKMVIKTQKEQLYYLNLKVLDVCSFGSKNVVLPIHHFSRIFAIMARK